MCQVHINFPKSQEKFFLFLSEFEQVITPKIFSDSPWSWKILSETDLNHLRMSTHDALYLLMQASSGRAMQKNLRLHQRAYISIYLFPQTLNCVQMQIPVKNSGVTIYCVLVDSLMFVRKCIDKQTNQQVFILIQSTLTKY